MKTEKSTLPILLAFAVFVAGLALAAFSPDAEARSRSFSSSRSYSSTRTYSAPKPVPRPVVVQKNVTHVHQTVNQSGGGSGFVSSMAGAFAGSAVGSWLFNDKPAEAAPAAPAQQLVPVDCAADAYKTLPICNAGAK